VRHRLGNSRQAQVGKLPEADELIERFFEFDELGLVTVDPAMAKLGARVVW
jgi:hypothetical protein